VTEVTPFFNPFSCGSQEVLQDSPTMRGELDVPFAKFPCLPSSLLAPGFFFCGQPGKESTLKNMFMCQPAHPLRPGSLVVLNTFFRTLDDPPTVDTKSFGIRHASVPVFFFFFLSPPVYFFFWESICRFSFCAAALFSMCHVVGTAPEPFLPQPPPLFSFYGPRASFFFRG